MGFSPSESPPAPLLAAAAWGEAQKVLCAAARQRLKIDKQRCKATSVGAGQLLLPFQGLYFRICKDLFLICLCFPSVS